MKRESGPQRRTVSKLIGLHVTYLTDLRERLDKGAKIATVIADWKAQCAAVAEIESLFGTDLANRKGGP